MGTNSRDIWRVADELGVSRSQIDRWRASRLLYSGVKQTGLGYARGTVWEYPDDAIEQLRAVVALRASGMRGTRNLRVRLWLKDLAASSEQVRRDLLGAIPAIDLPGDEDEALDRIDAYTRAVDAAWAKARKTPIDRRRLRKMADRWTVIGHLLLSALLPSFRADVSESIDEDESRTTGEVIEQALDVDRGRLPANDVEPWLSGAPGKAIATIAANGWLNLDEWRKAIGRASVAALDVTRRDLQALQSGGAALRDLRRAGHMPEHSFGLRSLERFASADLMTIAGGAAVVLIARRTGYREELEALTAALTKLAGQVDEAGRLGWSG